MTYQLNSIANYFIDKANKQGNSDLTPMKLLKLVYIAHGWSLAISNKALFHEEVHAWKYGPVIPPLYHSVKRFKSLPVTEPLPEFTGSFIQEGDKKVLDFVWNQYGRYDGIRLSAITHKEDSPWYKVWNESRETVIPGNLIKDYYGGLYAQALRNLKEKKEESVNAS